MSLTLGVVSDTHVPDRVRELHPEILPAFRRAGVRLILHAGDVSSPAVLDELAQIAPVQAVRGNRDSWRLRGLPLNRTVEVDGITIGMLHGHGDFGTYARDSLAALIHGGISYTRYIQRVQTTFPKARVVVFGHIHRPVNLMENGQLLFNPGAASKQISPNIPPSVGTLKIFPDGQVQGKILFLSRWD